MNHRLESEPSHRFAKPKLGAEGWQGLTADRGQARAILQRWRLADWQSAIQQAGSLRYKASQSALGLQALSIKLRLHGKDRAHERSSSERKCLVKEILRGVSERDFPLAL
jgi:hypothetical protein